MSSDNDKKILVHIATVGREVGPVTKVLGYLGAIEVLYLLFTENENIEKSGNIENRERIVTEDGSTNTIKEPGSMNYPENDNAPTNSKGKPFINGSREVAELIESTEQNKIPRIELRRIPLFEFDGICDVIADIYNKEKGPNIEFSVNITSGTNLMAAALCFMSYYINAKMFYAGNQKAPLKDQVKEVGKRTAVDLEKMNPEAIKVLKKVYDETYENREPITITQLHDKYKDISVNKFSYYTRILVKDELIEEKDFYDTKVVKGKTIRKLNDRKNGLVITGVGAIIVKHLLKPEKKESEELHL